jgi:CubicO group peptidase (beta-lactamase class C family)
LDAARIARLFHENFATRGELGASVSVWKDGREILSLAAGFQDRAKTEPWTAETPVLFWSATKGLSAACLLHACERRGVPLHTRVAELWPDFAQSGKEHVTIAEILSHRAGLAALDREASALDHDAVSAALAAQTPNWPRGDGHGYHPRTFGYLLDEILRRITGTPLREYWRANFGEPLAIDVWIGMPEERVRHASSIFPAKNPPPTGDPFYTAFFTPGSLTARAFTSPRGLHSVASMNTPEARATPLGAFGGIGTARGLAKFYAMLAGGGALDGRRYFESETLDAMKTTLSQGRDRILQIETAFSAGFMRDPLGAAGRKARANFGPSLTAFGHPGAGGSHAFADPENRVAFAYVMNQMEPGVLPNEKSLRLVEALYAQ